MISKFRRREGHKIWTLVIKAQYRKFGQGTNHKIRRQLRWKGLSPKPIFAYKGEEGWSRENLCKQFLMFLQRNGGEIHCKLLRSKLVLGMVQTPIYTAIFSDLRGCLHSM